MSPDTLTTIALVAAAALLALLVHYTEPGCLSRYRAASRYHRDGQARHAVGYRPPLLAIAAPASAVATIPDPTPFTRAAA